jgi:hypothetical protein
MCTQNRIQLEPFYERMRLDRTQHKARASLFCSAYCVGADLGDRNANPTSLRYITHEVTVTSLDICPCGSIPDL